MRFKSLAITCQVLVLVATVFSRAASAQSNGATEQVLLLFGASAPDAGDNPVTGLTFDQSGNLYGSTIGGGLYPNGTVFEMTNSGGVWAYTIAYNFGSIPHDGYYSASPLVFDADGNLYGTTQQGGTHGEGTVFQLVRSQSGVWTENQLYSFQGGTDGAYPQGNIALDSEGNIYGTTTSGGSSSGYGYGTVFQVAPAGNGTWRERLLHRFTGGIDGNFPYGGLTIDGSGNLFGTTMDGGAEGYGVVFELIRSGNARQMRIIHTFDSCASSQPFGNLIVDASGNLYGTTAQCGGSVFEMTPVSSSWRFHTLYTFSGETAPIFPYDGVVRDSSGNLYGTSYFGGTQNEGTVFEVSPTNSGKWTMQVLHSFSYNIVGPLDGFYPEGGLVIDSFGNLYGTTFYGGYSNEGTVFEVTP
jgi:uncharacterized repeat protein (TIGR03803 family)